MSEIIILFGEMGAGKNYHGERIAKALNCEFYDGDRSVPPDMAERVAQFKPLDRAMIERFISQLTDTIIEKADKAPKLVVAQALYFDQDRWDIQKDLNTLGHRVRFKWIKPPFLQNLKQVSSRPNGKRWALYWLMNKFFFQKPTHPHELVK